MRRLFAFASRHPGWAIAGACTAAIVTAFAVIGSGIVPIAASSGHWAVTEWLLHLAMRRSVITHTLAGPSPPADFESEANVVRGAGHYETGCRTCHGAPGEPLPAIPQAMTPHPPALPGRIPDWTAPQLFYIVKHGVKFTGMPAWPAQSRDDEVWSVVGFLRRLPDMSAAEYDALVGQALPPATAAGDDGAHPTPELIAAVCARCHGEDGGARGKGAFPKLAGQRLEYMVRAMRAYASGQRYSGIMAPLAQRYTGDALAAALNHYASSSRPAAEPIASEAAVARGAELAQSGSPADEIPPCAACHEARPVNPAFPRLHGQYPNYLAQQLRLLQQGNRGGSEFVPLMHSFVERLTEQQITDVSRYYAATVEPAH